MPITAPKSGIATWRARRRSSGRLEILACLRQPVAGAEGLLVAESPRHAHRMKIGPIGAARIDERFTETIIVDPVVGGGETMREPGTDPSGPPAEELENRAAAEAAA